MTRPPARSRFSAASAVVTVTVMATLSNSLDELSIQLTGV
jgi:hypothetical protein